jgi:dCMP deaminase
MTRPDWDTYFMNFARLAEQRSTCLRRRVGAVIVKDRMVLATGYNGAPKGLTHCSTVGCLREQRHIPSGERAELCRGLHAEQNAIVQAAYHGVAIREAAIYCTMSPCVICVKMMINAGIKRFFFGGLYDDSLAQEMAAEAGLELIRLEVPPEPSGR